jgi:hypothetical protein
MKSNWTFILLLLVFLFACDSEKLDDNIDSKNTIDYLLQDNSIEKLTIENHKKLEGIKGDFEGFKLYISKLSDDSLTSIPFALDYIKSCLSVDKEKQDSVLLYFNQKFYTVSNRLSDSLETKYKSILEQQEENSNNPDLKVFTSNLTTCGIGIFTTEGTYYLDVLPDFFFDNFKDRVSVGVRQFLEIRKDELKDGFSEDAGLLISFEDLYKRVKRWEDFRTKYPNNVYDGETRYYYETYLETLLTGMDNSRVFETDSNLILPEVKKLYESIINKEADSPTKNIVSSYYSFLGRHNFQENDSIDLFLKSNNLSTMLAVQPHNR